MSSSTKPQEKKSRHGDSSLNLDLMKALSHPIRYRALNILNLRIASPNEIANEIGKAVNLVAYHVRELERFGCAELVDTKPRRGATEHFYRATARAHLRDGEWALIPTSIRTSMIGEQIAQTGKDLGDALQDGTFERRADRHCTYTPVVVDDQAWGETMDLLTETLERLFDIQAGAASRLAESEEAGFSMLVSLMGFEKSQP